LNFNRPRNETETHFLLKEISKYILFGWGYKMLATEVHGMWDLDIGKKRKEIIDAVGLKNGFCCAPAMNYIICPINTIPIELIPDKVGCIIVDLDNFELKKWSQKIPDMKGVTLVKKAQKRIDSRFKDEEAYRKWCEKSIEGIAYRSTSELLFWRNYIEFSK